MNADLADLLGETDDDGLLIEPPIPERRGPGRPTKAEAEARAAQQAALNMEPPDAAVFFQPVGITFLANVFRKHKVTIAKKLSDCPVKGYALHKGQQVPLYDFVQAAGYIVDPKIDLMTWIKSQRAQDLPPHINDQFWKSQRNKQAWEREARELWHTDDVLAVLSKVGMVFKETTQLWIENLPGKANLTDEQYRALMDSVTALQIDLHQRLVEIPMQQRTESSVRSLDDVIQQAETDAIAAHPPTDDEEVLA